MFLREIRGCSPPFRLMWTYKWTWTHTNKYTCLDTHALTNRVKASRESPRSLGSGVDWAVHNPHSIQAGESYFRMYNRYWLLIVQPEAQIDPAFLSTTTQYLLRSWFKTPPPEHLPISFTLVLRSGTSWTIFGERDGNAKSDEAVDLSHGPFRSELGSSPLCEGGIASQGRSTAW